jgi:hypothetical protein
MKHKNDSVNSITISCNFLWGLLNRNYLLHVKLLWGLLNVYLSLVSLADNE